MVQATLTNVRVEGLHARRRVQVEQDWQELNVSTHPTTTALQRRLLGYVACASAGLRPGERLLGSTEVLEAAFGVPKRLAADQVESGVSGLALALGAVLGEHSAETIAAALKAVPQQQAARWAQRWLGQTVQWLRRQFVGQPAVDPGVPISG